MLWKFYLDLDDTTDTRQWEEILGSSPWDFVTAPNWPGTDIEDPWDFSNQYWDTPQNEGQSPDPGAAEGDPQNGKWETNPITGVKIWIANK